MLTESRIPAMMNGKNHQVEKYQETKTLVIDIDIDG